MHNSVELVPISWDWKWPWSDASDLTSHKTHRHPQHQGIQLQGHPGTMKPLYKWLIIWFDLLHVMVNSSIKEKGTSWNSEYDLGILHDCDLWLWVPNILDPQEPQDTSLTTCNRHVHHEKENLQHVLSEVRIIMVLGFGSVSSAIHSTTWMSFLLWKMNFISPLLERYALFELLMSRLLVAEYPKRLQFLEPCSRQSCSEVMILKEWVEQEVGENVFLWCPFRNMHPSWSGFNSCWPTRALNYSARDQLPIIVRADENINF